jgi:hypothetical protein
LDLATRFAQSPIWETKFRKVGFGKPGLHKAGFGKEGFREVGVRKPDLRRAEFGKPGLAKLVLEHSLHKARFGKPDFAKLDWVNLVCAKPDLAKKVFAKSKLRNPVYTYDLGITLAMPEA